MLELDRFEHYQGPEVRILSSKEKEKKSAN